MTTEEVRTAGLPHHLRLVADCTALAADGQDLALVAVRVEDAWGNLCPDAAPEVSFAVSGAGRFRAVGNGDPTSLELFQQPRMHAFHGQLVAIVQAAGPAGAVQLTAVGPGLKSGVVVLGLTKAGAK